MKHVVIVESPAKCKTIQKYLGKDYSVLASFGHIRDLPSKDGSVEPDNDFTMHYEISADSTKHVAAIVSAVKSADSLILATDPDREGEAISWHVLEMLKQKKALGKGLTVQRVSFNAITKAAVTHAIENPRTLDMDLVNAQQARRALDYLVGFNLSPVLWRKLPGSKSAGRVQSVALRLICEREEEIERFVTQEYWDIKAQLTAPSGEVFTATLQQLDGKKLDKFSLANENDAMRVQQQLAKAQYSIKEVGAKQVQRQPKPPFTTSTLQQEASRKLGFTASRTMQVAQKLYEGVDIGGETAGLITYMRTDGVSIAPEAMTATRNQIEKQFGKDYLPNAPRMYQSKQKNAQEAHEAIRPTDVSRTPDAMRGYLSEEQFKLYELVWKRVMASQMAAAVLDQVSADVITADGKAMLRAVGSTVRFPGFYALYREGWDDGADEDEGGLLPPLSQGMKVALAPADNDNPNPLAEQHFTQPPPRYSEASLVKKLEELGIGRPSTYASIISVLQAREYVTLDKKRFLPEVRGRLVTAFLSSFFPRYVEYDFTANLEDELDEISAGKLDWKEALRKFWKGFHAAVEGAMQLPYQEVTDALDKALEKLLFPGHGDVAAQRTCPSCNTGRLGLKAGKFGAFLGCSNYPECNYTKQLAGSGESAEGENAQDSGGTNEPKVLGNHPESGTEITLRKGPYGWYVQLGEAANKKEKPKRQSLTKGMQPEVVTLGIAVNLLALPREVGMHPETGKKVTASVGRFGPYVAHDGVFASLKAGDDVLTIGINRAVDILAEKAASKAAGGGRGGPAPLRVVGKHPESGEELAVYKGRYGAYTKYQGLNITLPRNAEPETITLEELVPVVNAKAGKGGAGSGKKPSAKATKARSAAKKEAAKKPAIKKAPATKKAPAKKAGKRG